MGTQNMKAGPDASVPLKTIPRSQNVKKGPDALITPKKVFGRA
jgi:hypothetical protein